MESSEEDEENLIEETKKDTQKCSNDCGSKCKMMMKGSVGHWFNKSDSEGRTKLKIYASTKSATETMRQL